MFRYFFISIVASLSCTTVFTQTQVEQCLADRVLAEQIERDSSVLSLIKANEEFTRTWIARHQDRPAPRTVVTVPVVVHVVWNRQAENISDEQVMSQIEVINEDFRMLNNNLEGIPSEFSNLTADTEIEFCLASRDPDGLPSTGITRTKTEVAFIGDNTSSDGRYRVKHDGLGGKSAWDTRSYLNIWVAKFTPGLLGFGCFPGACSALEDGVVVDTDVFGRTGTVATPNHLGRTTTHEIGHYFNLSHLWGNKTGDCNGDDMVSDTPPQFASTTGCPNHPKASCSSNDMFMNYMDYTDDECVAMFTKGQTQRMQAQFSGSRRTLMDSKGCQLPVSTHTNSLKGKVDLYPNPARDFLQLELQLENHSTVQLQLVDIAGQVVFEAQIPAVVRRKIPLQNLPAGLYLLRLKNENGSLSKKILKLP